MAPRPDMGQGDFIETVFTCKGNYYDPDFPKQLEQFNRQLHKLLQAGDDLVIKKVEPWNSVKVTVNIPKEAAERLKQLARQDNGALRSLGIMAIEIEGDRIISLTLSGKGDRPSDSVAAYNTSNPASLPGSLSIPPTSSGALQLNCIDSSTKANNILVTTKEAAKSKDVLSPANLVAPQDGKIPLNHSALNHVHSSEAAFLQEKRVRRPAKKTSSNQRKRTTAKLAVGDQAVSQTITLVTMDTSLSISPRLQPDLTELTPNKSDNGILAVEKECTAADLSQQASECSSNPPTHTAPPDIAEALIVHQSVIKTRHHSTEHGEQRPQHTEIKNIPIKNTIPTITEGDCLQGVPNHSCTQRSEILNKGAIEHCTEVQLTDINSRKSVVPIAEDHLITNIDEDLGPEHSPVLSQNVSLPNPVSERSTSTSPAVHMETCDVIIEISQELPVEHRAGRGTSPVLAVGLVEEDGLSDAEISSQSVATHLGDPETINDAGESARTFLNDHPRDIPTYIPVHCGVGHSPTTGNGIEITISCSEITPDVDSVNTIGASVSEMNRSSPQPISVIIENDSTQLNCIGMVTAATVSVSSDLDETGPEKESLLEPDIVKDTIYADGEVFNCESVRRHHVHLTNEDRNVERVGEYCAIKSSHLCMHECDHSAMELADDHIPDSGVCCVSNAKSVDLEVIEHEHGENGSSTSTDSGVVVGSPKSDICATPPAADESTCKADCCDSALAATARYGPSIMLKSDGTDTDSSRTALTRDSVYLNRPCVSILKAKQRNVGLTQEGGGKRVISSESLLSDRKELIALVTEINAIGSGSTRPSSQPAAKYNAVRAGMLHETKPAASAKQTENCINPVQPELRTQGASRPRAHVIVCSPKKDKYSTVDSLYNSQKYKTVQQRATQRMNHNNVIRDSPTKVSVVEREPVSPVNRPSVTLPQQPGYLKDKSTCDYFDAQCLKSHDALVEETSSKSEELRVDQLFSAKSNPVASSSQNQKETSVCLQTSVIVVNTAPLNANTNRSETGSAHSCTSTLIKIHSPVLVIDKQLLQQPTELVQTVTTAAELKRWDDMADIRDKTTRYEDPAAHNNGDGLTETDHDTDSNVNDARCVSDTSQINGTMDSHSDWSYSTEQLVFENPPSVSDQAVDRPGTPTSVHPDESLLSSRRSARVKPTPKSTADSEAFKGNRKRIAKQFNSEMDSPEYSHPNETHVHSEYAKLNHARSKRLPDSDENTLGHTPNKRATRSQGITDLQALPTIYRERRTPRLGKK